MNDPHLAVPRKNTTQLFKVVLRHQFEIGRLRGSNARHGGSWAVESQFSHCQALVCNHLDNSQGLDVCMCGYATVCVYASGSVCTVYEITALSSAGVLW
jgi:hypothetical protein